MEVADHFAMAVTQLKTLIFSWKDSKAYVCAKFRLVVYLPAICSLYFSLSAELDKPQKLELLRSFST